MAIAPQSAYDSWKTRSPDDEAASIRFAIVLDQTEHRMTEALEAACREPIAGTLKVECTDSYADDRTWPHGGSVELRVSGINCDCDGDESSQIADALGEVVRRLRNPRGHRANTNTKTPPRS